MIPLTWTPLAKMERIIVHWTAGRYTPTANDKSHYHILIDGMGEPVKGTPSIRDNQAPLKKGYAAHTRNCNSGSIGVSICAMFGAVESPFDAGNFPITEAQWSGMLLAVAELADSYDIPVTPRTILTHAEVQGTLGIKQLGKWDIARLPFKPELIGAKAVGDFMRKGVVKELDEYVDIPPPLNDSDAVKAEKYRVSGVKPSKLNWRDGPNGAVISAVPEGTILEKLVETPEGWWMVRSPAGYVGWVYSSYLTPA